MKSQYYIVNQANGISSKTYALLVSLANRYTSEITIHYGTENANLKSIINAMTLIIDYQGVFELTIDGVDEDNNVLDKFTDLLSKQHIDVYSK